jgi:hypothetical protein
MKDSYGNKCFFNEDIYFLSDVVHFDVKSSILLINVFRND